MGQKFRLTPASFPVGLPTSAGTHFFRCSAYLTLCISDYFRHHARFQAFNAPARAGPNADYRRVQNTGTNKMKCQTIGFYGTRHSYNCNEFIWKAEYINI